MFPLFRKRLQNIEEGSRGPGIVWGRRSNNENISVGHCAVSIERRGVGANWGLHHGGSEGSKWRGGSERGGHRYQQQNQRGAVNGNEFFGDLQFPRSDSRNLPRESRGARLRDRPPDEHRAPGTANGSPP